MENKPGTGPTRPDKTLERMAQERQSPGATTAGGPAKDVPGNGSDPKSESTSSTVAPSTFAANEMRRGDSAATASADGAQTSPGKAGDEGDDDTRDATAASREERIRQTAYRHSQGRNESEGDAVSDWLKAEAEVDALDIERGAAARSQSPHH